MRRPARLLALATVTGTIAGGAPLAAAPNAWTPIGPPGAPALSVDGGAVVRRIFVDAADRRVLWASGSGNPGGLFRSDDGGDTWLLHAALPALAGMPPFLEVDPGPPAVLWAQWGTDGGGVPSSLAKSLDGGATFTPTALPGAVRALAVDAAGATLYALTDHAFVRSTDGGATWAGETPGGTALVADPHVPGTLFTARGDGVERSVDGGATWDPTAWGGPVEALFADRATPARIYATTAFDPMEPGSAVRRSPDAGATWEPVGPPADVSRLTIDPQDPDRLFAYGATAGLHRSPDGGVSWQPPVLADVTVNDVSIDPAAPATLYAATHGSAVLRSTDGGDTWTVLGTGVLTATDVLTGPGTPPVLYAATESGLFRSADGGASWQPGGKQILPRVLAAHPTVAATILAATSGAFAEGGAVHRSVDGGDDWGDPLVTASPRTGFTALAIDPAAPERLYAAVSNGAGSGTLRASHDGGATWPVPVAFPPEERPQLGEVCDVVVHAADRSVLIAARSPFPGVWEGILRSIDGGVHWAPMGLADATAVTVDPAAPTTLYAGTDAGELFVSADGGGSWTSLGAPNGQRVHALLVDPADVSRVFAATERGVLVSGDRGATWTDIGPPRRVRALATHPLNPRTVLAASDLSGVIAFETVACASDAECDDGDACTVDACAPDAPAHDVFGCSREPAGGFVAIDCLFAATVGAPPCTEVRDAFWQRLVERLGRVRARVAGAAQRRTAARARSLRAAKRDLSRLRRRLVRGPWRDEPCHTELALSVRALRTAVAALRGRR
jgi:photosystem II stability/assembly factor-like uncharacterized protein